MPKEQVSNRFMTSAYPDVLIVKSTFYLLFVLKLGMCEYRNFEFLTQNQVAYLKKAQTNESQLFWDQDQTID